jgi:hypothetical protein
VVLLTQLVSDEHPSVCADPRLKPTSAAPSAITTASEQTLRIILKGWHLPDVEVHHVDLRVGYEPGGWPAAFVDGELIRRLRGLPDQAEHADLLAWLLGRVPAPDLRAW